MRPLQFMCTRTNGWRVLHWPQVEPTLWRQALLLTITSCLVLNISPFCLSRKNLPSAFLRGLRRNSDLCKLWKTVPQNRLGFHFQSIMLQCLGLPYPSRCRLCGELVATNNVFSWGLDLDPSIVFILPVRPGMRGYSFKVWQVPSRCHRRKMSSKAGRFLRRYTAHLAIKKVILHRTPPWEQPEF